MACVEKWKVIWCICFVVIRALRTEALDTEALGPAPEFLKHVVIRPKIFHGREKRSLQSTRKHQNGLEHVHDIVVSFNLHGKDHLLDLRLNRELIPNNYFERHQKNGSHVTRRPRGKDFELCHYIGKLRGVKNSWAALSTCNGLSGVVYNGESLHYIEKSKSGDSSNSTSSEGENEGNFDGMIDGSVEHYIYSHEDLDTNLNRTCGYSGTAENHHITHFHADKLRYKRSDGSDDAQDIRGPYNANKMSRYVELVLVVDNRDYKELGESLPKVYTHCKNIANIINALYMPLNIFIALVGVVVWSEMDEIALSENGDTTLTNFLHYRRAQLFKEYPNDNAQLLTRMQFENGVVGKALKGPICTFEFSGGVSMDHSPVIGLVATTVAHEMGHNFGMEHDSAGCECPEERCIMAPSSSSMSPTHWSSCSMEYLAFAFEHGMDYCLRNKPKGLFGSPVCGNGFVEAGEQCDCGLKEHCNNPCCNASTCMLYSNASCATGECCDLKTCRPRTAGSVCRTADHECDLPEYCTGQSEYCPKDVFKMDGEACDRGKAFCYQGSCRSHSDQCKLLWGPSGKSSDLQCYKMNMKGSRYGNCGYNRLNQSYIKCENDNIQCGMLHCMHLNERLEFGMETVSILSHSFLSSGDKNIIPCRSVIVDLGLNEVDPGLAPDGAKCGPDMMCVNQKCMNVSSLRANTKEGACPMGCSGNGVCNSNGHCHCKPGFAPPICDYPGTGGSADSGPAADPNARQEVIVALYLVFLGIVPFVALVALFTYYMRRNPVFWRKKPRSIIIIEKKSSSGLHPRGGSSDNGPKSGHMINDNSRASLLPHSESSPPVHVCDDSPITSLQNNLLGQFKGFSITPLPAKSSSTTSSMPATCLPTRPAPQPVSPPKVPSNVAVVAPVRPAPKIPPTSVGLALNSHEPPTLPPANAVPTRPAISSPVLDATTSCTAQELLSTAPIRAAPSVPEIRPSRPVSSPVIPEETHDIKPGKPIKDASYPALTRIASFMARNQKDGIKKDNVSGGSLRINRLDRDTLRNLEISNPIPQKEIEVSGVALPAGSNKVVVMRAQSMRDSENKKPHIHSFGSMRASGAKRPTSIPVAARPTSPPPPRPPSIGLPGYQTPGKIENTYDDCLNMLTENGVPLANIDEESPNSATDNIYAVIEESPTDRRERKEIVLPKKLEHTSPSNEYNLPKALENTVSTGSSESMGLLGEIVSEIQARNTDSIYSTSTLKRKKENDDETSSTITIADSDLSDTKSNQIYVNTPWQGYDKLNSASKSCASSNSSNSGYLSPINASQTSGGPKMFVETESKNNSDVPSVPDASAPSYKPYSSSLQRNNGPFAALYNKTPTEPKLQNDSVNQTASNLSDNKSNRFMPNNVNKMLQESSLRRINTNDNPSKISLNSAKVPVSSSVTLNKNNISIPVTSSKSAQEGVKKQGNVSAQPKSAASLAGVKGSASVKSPVEQKVSGGGKIDNAEVSSLPSSKQDLVIKTAHVGSKQVLENKSDVKNPASLKTVPKISSFRTGRTPIPAPKPVVIPNVKSSGSVVPVKTKQPLSKTAVIKQSAPGSSDTSSNNKPDVKSGVIKPVSKSSNVASLQQKFETGAKQPVQRTVNTVSNRNNTNPKTPHSDPDVKRTLYFLIRL
ncbi:disintegrin and metalloproteinase domain-containing protein meltrin [Lycorma delicatula]|uniref:disintegrin and metalloproteinase domain-containing protein meltrin n=1 Tax=Lycorma delicatula TaxID=130591 RepID=UPI003F51223A